MSRIRELREPEIEDLHRTVRRDLDIRRLEISMDDPLLVRRFERLADLPRDRQRLVERHRSARDAIGERLTFDQFEDERVDFTAVLEAINRRNVWVIERRQHLRLAREA